MGFKESDIKVIWETLIEIDDMVLGKREKIEIIRDFLKGKMKYNLEDVLKLDKALNSPAYYKGREPAYLIREIKKKRY